MLYLFDIDGTICRSFLREGASRADFDLVEVLPGRRAALDALRTQGQFQRHEIALLTNQGGVALGYQTVPQVARKIGRVLDAINERPRAIRCEQNALIDFEGIPIEDEPRFVCPNAYVSFGLPHATISRYRTSEDDQWRKPGGSMIMQAMLDYNIPADLTCYVGDMESDRLAAERAGVAYHDADEFFAL